MTSSTKLARRNQSDIEGDMFSDLEPIDPFEIKKDYLSSALAALVSFCGKSRSALAEELGWEKSRVSKVLSGRSNLTMKTVWDVASHCGYDFEVVFLSPNSPRPHQPWQASMANIVTENTLMLQRGASTVSPIVIQMQSAEEVAMDIRNGTSRSHYFNLMIPNMIGNAPTAISAMTLADTIPASWHADEPITVEYTRLK